MYRPEGWKTIECNLPQTLEEKCLTATAKEFYEAGADAMLEGLRKQPRVKYLNYETPNPAFPFPATYYLIPEES